MFSILELVTCFKAGGPRLGLTMSQGATRKKSLGTTVIEGPGVLGMKPGESMAPS